MVPRESEGNAYATFWGDKQRALWYVTVFSGVVIDSGLVDGHNFNRWYICLERRPLRLTVSLRKSVHDYPMTKWLNFLLKLNRGNAKHIVRLLL